MKEGGLDRVGKPGVRIGPGKAIRALVVFLTLLATFVRGDDQVKQPAPEKKEKEKENEEEGLSPAEHKKMMKDLARKFLDKNQNRIPLEKLVLKSGLDHSTLIRMIEKLAAQGLISAKESEMAKKKIMDLSAEDLRKIQKVSDTVNRYVASEEEAQEVEKINMGRGRTYRMESDGLKEDIDVEKYREMSRQVESVLYQDED